MATASSPRQPSPLSFSSSSSLAMPDQGSYAQQRRMSLPPPPSALDLPEPVHDHRMSNVRSSSPLRNGMTHLQEANTNHDPDEDEDDEDDEDDEATWGRRQGNSYQRAHSPASSVSQLASSFAQRVGTLMSPASGTSAHLPSDAELEADAERERDRSRREAERILTQEADERRRMEERVLAMMNGDRAASPRPIPPRAHTMPSPMSSPSGRDKDDDGGGAPGWWKAAKARLTPTKEPLTPAQQVVHETKAREKAEKKGTKGKERERSRSAERPSPSPQPAWPANGQGKYTDPAMLNLSVPPPVRKPVPSPQASPTPSRPTVATMTPSPSSVNVGASPGREAPPLYAQFTANGALDVPGTLLVLARRFEKLERWSVGHVRALEERMGDVERWLVDKEAERERSQGAERSSPAPQQPAVEVRELKEELVELQSRVGALGREMAQLPHLSTVRPPRTVEVATAHPKHIASESAEHSDDTHDDAKEDHPDDGVDRAPSLSAFPLTPVHRRPPSTAVETSPPLASGHAQQGSSSRTRLTRPLGDYASPPSASGSPNLSGLPAATASPTAPLSSGLPSPSAALNPPKPASPRGASASPTPTALNPPKAISPRGDSTSPTPQRKRYTVALGAPITSTRFTSSPSPTPDEDTEDTEDAFTEETIGRRSGAGAVPASAPVSTPSRVRPQSMYGTTAPLQPRARSRSTVGLGITDGGGSKFVDPLVTRRQELKDTLNNIGAKKAPGAGTGKVPVGQLVAFFDGERERERGHA